MLSSKTAIGRRVTRSRRTPEGGASAPSPASDSYAVRRERGQARQRDKCVKVSHARHGGIKKAASRRARRLERSSWIGFFGSGHQAGAFVRLGLQVKGHRFIQDVAMNRFGHAVPVV